MLPASLSALRGDEICHRVRIGPHEEARSSAEIDFYVAQIPGSAGRLECLRLGQTVGSCGEQEAVLEFASSRRDE